MSRRPLIVSSNSSSCCPDQRIVAIAQAIKKKWFEVPVRNDVRLTNARALANAQFDTH